MSLLEKRYSDPAKDNVFNRKADVAEVREFLILSVHLVQLPSLPSDPCTELTPPYNHSLYHSLVGFTLPGSIDQPFVWCIRSAPVLSSRGVG